MHHPLSCDKGHYSRYFFYYMKNYIKKILIFVVCFVLLLVPFSNCFAIVAEAASGAFWAVAGSAGVSMSSTGITLGSDSWNEFNNDLGIGIAPSIYDFNSSNGSITVDASYYNAVLDSLSNAWGGNSPTFKPALLNSQTTFYNDYSLGSDSIMSYTIANNFPSEVRCGSSSDITSREYQFSLYFDVTSTGVFTVPPIPQVPSVTPYNTVYGYYLYKGGDRQSFNAPYSKSLSPGNYHLVIRCRFVRSSSDPLPYLLGYLPINGYPEILSQSTLSSFTPSDSTFSAELSVKPLSVDIDGVLEIVNGSAALVAQKIQNPQGKTVTLTPILPNNQKPLQGLPWLDVEQALEQGFFDAVFNAVNTVIGEGDLDPADEEDTPDLIYGEVSWIRRITHSIETKLDDIKEAIEEFFANQGSGTPVFPDEPPDFLGGGDGGLRFHISGIWHYVVSFVQSLGGAFTLFGSVWNGLPSTMFAAVYAAAVVVIVVGLFKRYIG